MTRPDIVVIGGGIIGLAIAWRLAQADLHVQVLDAGAPAATRAAAGMLAPSFESATGPRARPLGEFARHSLMLWRSFAATLEEETGVAIDYRADGVIAAAATEAELEMLVRRADQLEREGVRLERLRPQDLAALEPALAPGLVGGVFALDDGEVDARLVLTALTRALDRRGVGIERRRVRRIEARDDGLIDVASEDGATILAKTVVLAAGSLASAISGRGVPKGLRVFPVKGEALALAGSPLRHVVRSEGAYLCPKADGRLVIGATSLLDEASLDVDAARLAALRSRAEALCPALRPLAELERWSGLRPATEDGAPILGPDPDGPPGVLYALGHYRNGVLLAPATAEAILACVLGTPAAGAASLFAPRRWRA